jgi:hypothetical protein
VSEGYFAGRSGHVLFTNPESRDPDTTVVFVPHSNIEGSQNTESLTITNTADVILRGLGVEPLDQSFVPTFLTTSLFSTAPCNFLFSIQSLDKEQVYESAPLLSRLMRDSSSLVADVEHLSAPYSPLAAFTTMNSGVTPSQHGIIGERWQNENQIVEAFDQKQGNLAASQADSVNDMIQTAFEGESLTMSVSGSAQYAAAACVHRSLLSHDFCVSPTTTGDYVSSSSRPRAVNEALRADVLTLIQQLTTSNGVLAFGDASIEGNTIKVGSVAFDLGIESDRSFFLELQYINNLLLSLSDPTYPLASLVSDSVADSYTFAFTSLQGLTGDKYTAAVHFLDTAIPHFLASMKQAYPGALIEVVLAGTPSPTAAPTAEVLAGISDLAHDQTSASHSLYLLPDAASDLAISCASIAQKAAGFQVHCPGLHALVSAPQRALFSSSSTSSDVTSDDIERYQIVLWFSIAWAFVLYFVLYGIGFMSNRKDPMMYGEFSTDVSRRNFLN